MARTRVLVGTVLATAALALLPAPAATAHVHGVTPLNCTPAPANAGANQTEETPAGALFSGAIPVQMGGNVPLFGGGFGAAVCSR